MKIFDQNMRKLVRLAFIHRKTFLTALMLTLFMAAIQPITAWMFSLVIDGLTTKGLSVTALFAIAAASVLLGSIGLLISSYSYFFSERLSLTMYFDLFDESYDRIVHANTSTEEEQNFQTAFAEAKQRLESIVDHLLLFFAGFVMQFVTGSIIIWLNFGAKYWALMVLASALPLLIYAPFTKKVRDQNLTTFKSNQKINLALAQIVDNLSLVRTYQTSRFEQRKAHESFDIYRANQIEMANGFVRFNALREITNAVLFIGFLYIIIDNVYSGLIGVGAMFLFYQYMQQLVTGFSDLPFWFLRLQRDLAHISPLLNADNLDWKIDETPPKTLPEIESMELRHFRCDYLPDLDPKAVYHFQSGEIYWLKGENGAGKSTLLKAIMGLSHEAQVDVEVVTKAGRETLSVKDRLRNFGYASQEPLIWDRTVRDNIDYARQSDFEHEIDEEDGERLEASPAFERIKFDENATALSGGQKQLIHIYRAIGKNSPVLLLDEPTNALDGEVILSLIETLKTRVPHAIVIMATHSEFLQKIATKEIRMQRLQ